MLNTLLVFILPAAFVLVVLISEARNLDLPIWRPIVTAFAILITTLGINFGMTYTQLSLNAKWEKHATEVWNQALEIGTKKSGDPDNPDTAAMNEHIRTELKPRPDSTFFSISIAGFLLTIAAAGMLIFFLGKATMAKSFFLAGMFFASHFFLSWIFDQLGLA